MRDIRYRKKLSVVYTKWDGSEPIPNGYDLLPSTFNRPISFFLSHGFFQTHLNDEHASENEFRYFDVHVTRVEDVTDDHLHIYALAHPNITYTEFETQGLYFNQKVIDLANRNKNFYILLSLEHEPDTEKGFLSICNKIEKDGINPKKVILLNNNSKLYAYKEKYKKDVIVHKSYFLNFSSTKVLDYDGSDFIEDKNGKFFVSKNRTVKAHRKNFIFDVLKNNLENDINYSFLNHNKSPIDDVDPFIEFQGEDVVNNNLDLGYRVNSMYKECDYEEGQNLIDKETAEFIHQDRFYHIYLIPETRDSFEHSYFNIVTESSFKDENLVHITEKSLRPFHYYQFPIFFATKGHVSQLKNDYKFDMYDDIIDHSYDNEEDYIKRYHMVIAEIKRLASIQDELKKYYIENKFRFTLNKEKLHSFGKRCRSLDMDLFWNLV